MITLIYPKDEATLSLVTDVQREFIERDNAGMHLIMDEWLYSPVKYSDAEVTFYWLGQSFGKGFTDCYETNPDEINLSKPRYIEFAWASDVPCHLELDFDEVTHFPGDPEPAEIIYPDDPRPISIAQAGNLFARTKYKWRIVSDDGTQVSEYRYFTTADEFPRALFVQGTASARDIGGIPRANGGHIRQGCLYRSAAVENIVDEGYKATERGLRVLRDIVKIKNDVDFRLESIEKLDKSPIGDHVKYHNLPARGYEMFFTPEYRHYWKPLIEFVADENNYPVLLHCAAGADRTGTFFQILELLLGVDIEYIRLDYTITSLSQRDYRCFNGYGECGRFLDGYKEGDDMMDVMRRNAEKFLIEDCGVSPETIERLKKNLIED